MALGLEACRVHGLHGSGFRLARHVDCGLEAFRFWGTGLYRSIGHVAFGLEAVRVYGLHGSGFKATDRGFANRGLKASGLCRSIGHVAFAGFHGSGLRFGV